MTPQPIPGTLLAAFQRFADLSCYWHRAHTPDSLAIQELQERQRLLVDIPELIKRLTAFSELGTDAMFAAYAKAKAAPPRDDAGQGWRMLDDGETIQDGDELWSNFDQRWCRSCNIGWPVDLRIARYRRRIAKEPPQDTAGHIRADFEPKREETPVTAQETASRGAWRMLEEGEVIESDDEITGDANWSPVSQYPYVIGCPVARGQHGVYRRRVTPPTPAAEPPQP